LASATVLWMLRASPRRRRSASVRVLEGRAVAATTPMMPSVASSSMVENPLWREKVRTPSTVARSVPRLECGSNDCREVSYRQKAPVPCRWRAFSFGTRQSRFRSAGVTEIAAAFQVGRSCGPEGPRLHECQRPRLHECQRPRLHECQRPRLHERQRSRLHERQRSRLHERQRPRLHERPTSAATSGEQRSRPRPAGFEMHAQRADGGGPKISSIVRMFTGPRLSARTPGSIALRSPTITTATRSAGRYLRATRCTSAAVTASMFGT
jgi:hypothetical protein